MNIDLRGKNALVGGSSKGIGRAIAEQLAISGANVTLMARSEIVLKQAVNLLKHNKNYKITDIEFDIWMRLLKNIKNSVLWLFISNIYSAINLSLIHI